MSQLQHPIVSVVMPVYNGEKYLAEAIESILSQSLSSFEFIIINDGSSDSSLTIIEGYAAIDSRIRVISRSNKGLIASLNEGIAIAKGTFIARMDADDISDSRRFEAQVKLLDDKQADICGCHYFIIDENGAYVDAAISPLSKESITIFLTNTTPFAHGSVMFRRDLLQRTDCRYGMTDAKSAEDYALWIELFDRDVVFSNVDQFLFKYRDFSASLSKVNRKASKKDALHLSRQFTLRHSEVVLSALADLSFNRVPNREQEILVMALLRLLFSAGKVGVVKYLTLFSKRNLTCGVMRFVGAK